MKQNKPEIWEVIEQNCQATALENELIQPGETFTLTQDQETAFDVIVDTLEDEPHCKLLLKAPTGAGKTEVFFRISVQRTLSQDNYTVIVLPTRDLARQQAEYLTSRLKDTPVEVLQIHGGIPPRKRTSQLQSLSQNKKAIIVASAIVIQHSKYKSLLEDSSLIVIDDVNAFDSEQDLPPLHRIKGQILYVTATPEAVESFLKKEGAWHNRFEMEQKPFDSPDTEVVKLKGHWNQNIFNQIELAKDTLQKHLDNGGRIFIISRTRAQVPIVANYIEKHYQVSTASLHGDMADSQEHRKRNRGAYKSTQDRISMMKKFKENKPAILVATNLIGSGLDIPMADMILVTDADHFGDAELEQLIGRVGRRQRGSDAILIEGTTLNGYSSGKTKARTFSRIRNGKIVVTYRPAVSKRGGYKGRRLT